MYDARFFDNQYLPGANRLSFVDGNNQVKEFVTRYQEELDINKNSLGEIFKSNFWPELVNRWVSPKYKLMECAMTCGEKFTKVWDQGGSIR